MTTYLYHKAQSLKQTMNSSTQRLPSFEKSSFDSKLEGSKLDANKENTLSSARGGSGSKSLGKLKRTGKSSDGKKTAHFGTKDFAVKTKK